MRYGSYEYYNANPLQNDTVDCTVRSISVALGMSWDSAYDMLSDLAQEQGVMQDNRDFIIDFLDNNFERVPTYGMNVREVVKEYDNYVILITMKGHIVCARYGKLYDTFDPSERLAEYCWIIE